MFEDIAEMEREIEMFRKNVVASSELIEGISRLTAETKKQKESFSTSTAELMKKIDTYVAQFKSDCESALRSLNDSNDATFKTFQTSLTTEQHARIAELERIRADFQKNLADAAAQTNVQVKALSTTSDTITCAFHEDTERIQNLSIEQIRQLNTVCERIISEAKSVLEAQQNAFAKKLQETETVIKGYQSTAENKYVEFINQLETTNVDQLYKEVQNLKKSIQIKFAIIMSGIGITLIVAVIGLILK